MADVNDWRLQGQEKYLRGAVLFYKRYADRRTKTDHDHCEFCYVRFSEQDPGALTAGYANLDDYRWICPSCYEDFKEMFAFQAGNPFD